MLTVRELRPVIPPFPYDHLGAFSVLEARESDTVKHDTARYPCKDGSTTRPKLPTGMPEVREGAFGVLLKVILLHNPDLKQEAILHGIRGAACTFACVWCLAARQDRKRRDGYKTREGFKFPPRTRECLLRDSARLRSFADPKQTDVIACHSQMGEPLAATFMSSRLPGELHHRTGLCIYAGSGDRRAHH